MLSEERAKDSATSAEVELTACAHKLNQIRRRGMSKRVKGRWCGPVELVRALL